VPDASLALVSAFHLVEHIPFELVQELIAEACAPCSQAAC
jgi:hypothetical protein